QHGVGRPLARFPSATDRAPQRLVHGLAREIHAVEWLHQDAARGLAAWRRGREGAEHPRLLVPARGMPALHESLHVGTEKIGQPIERERHHLLLALGSEIAAEAAADVD